MSNEFQEMKNIYFENLPEIGLVPNHGRMSDLPSYPLCAKREIFCGPNLENVESKERKYIPTKGRFFNINTILAQLNEKDQKIDVILAPLEASSTCFPSNLSKISCTKIGFIFDTHHLMNPLSTIINYVKREKFTDLFIYAQPAHLHFFYEAGITHTTAFRPHTQDFDIIKKKKNGITYIGSRWKSSHPHRCRMVQFLEKNLPIYNIPFYRYDRLPRAIWKKVLARSRIVVLSSLNGQFTPQINTILSSGALCFVDELSPQTFFGSFFESGKHLVTWSSFNDLLEKLIYYYNHPEEADEIANAGRIQAKKDFTTLKEDYQIIFDFVFNNEIDSRFLAINDKRCISKREEPPQYFNVRVRLYENIQELHRIHESLTLISLTERNFKPTSDLADLPRLSITHAFTSDKLYNEAYSYFQSVGVRDQVRMTRLNKYQKSHLFDIGILETHKETTNWEHLVKKISSLLKMNSLLWILGNLTPKESEFLFKEGFKPYEIRKNPIFLKLRALSRKICFGFWKFGKYPFPYLTIKPPMENVPNLNAYLRGWQSKFPFLY